MENSEGKAIGDFERFNIHIGTSLTLESIKSIEKKTFLDPLKDILNPRYLEKILKEGFDTIGKSLVSCLQTLTILST
uniref:Uncharacterized protein n=1 Tax=candidate division WOR-3 bacterium TaxID=2052148 RepID=A0A7C2K4R1_UNCW3